MTVCARTLLSHSHAECYLVSGPTIVLFLTKAAGTGPLSVAVCKGGVPTDLRSRRPMPGAGLLTVSSDDSDRSVSEPRNPAVLWAQQWPDCPLAQHLNTAHSRSRHSTACQLYAAFKGIYSVRRTYIASVTADFLKWIENSWWCLRSASRRLNLVPTTGKQGGRCYNIPSSEPDVYVHVHLSLQLVLVSFLTC